MSYTKFMEYTLIIFHFPSIQSVMWSHKYAPAYNTFILWHSLVVVYVIIMEFLRKPWSHLKYDPYDNFPVGCGTIHMYAHDEQNARTIVST